MATLERVGMPLAAFIEQHTQQPFELINGEKKLRMPTVFGHNDALHLLYEFLREYSKRIDLGLVRMETTFVLPDRYDSNWVSGSRTPDLLVVSSARFDAYKQSQPDYREKPLLLIPDFVVEVVSPNDRYSDIDEKVDAYLADGVRLIWVIDPQRKKAVVYAPDTEQPLHLAGDALLDGGDVLAGFRVQLSALFV